MRFTEPDSQPKSRLFRPGDSRTNACLNFIDSRRAYIVGYQRAADLLIEQVEESGREQDTLLFPIVFLFRHYLELQLKDIITTMREVLERNAPTDGEVTTTHDLGRLWEWANPLFSPLGDPESIREEIRDGNSVFAEFQRWDKNAETFRFARKRSGEPHLSEFRAINIRNFRDQCAKISDFLEGCACAADDAWQWHAERRAEVERDWR